VNSNFHSSYLVPDYPTSGLTVTGLAWVYCIWLGHGRFENIALGVFGIGKEMKSNVCLSVIFLMFSEGANNYYPTSMHALFLMYIFVTELVFVLS
jgi:hypothetical protein